MPSKSFLTGISLACKATLTSIPAGVTYAIIVDIVTFLTSILIWAAALVAYAIIIGVAELLTDPLIRLR